MSDEMTPKEIWEKAKKDAELAGVNTAAPLAPVAAPPAPSEITKPVEKKLIRLDIGCGQRKEVGWVGIDIAEYAKPDIVHDLFTFPWPVESDSVIEARMIHFFEHVPGRLRFAFMDELWRVLGPGAQCTVYGPYYNTMRAVQDPTHEWPPICEASFLYFNKEWRKANLLDHYPVHCDFDFSYGYAFDQMWVGKSDDTRAFGLKHYMNVANDLQVILTKRG